PTTLHDPRRSTTHDAPRPQPARRRPTALSVADGELAGEADPGAHGATARIERQSPPPRTRKGRHTGVRKAGPARRLRERLPTHHGPLGRDEQPRPSQAAHPL